LVLTVLDIKWLFCSIVSGNDGSTSKAKKGSHTFISRRQKLSKSDHETATVLMQSQMQWLYCRFLIPLLRSSFYITETEFTGKRVLHYRKPIWSSLKSLAIDELLQRQYKELSISEMTSKWLSPSSSQKMGFSRLRLLPKKTGIRPIAVLCKRLNINIIDSLLVASEKNSRSIIDRVKKTPRFQQLSTNAILRESFDVLKFEHSLAPSKFGAGVFGCHEVYPRLLKFLQNVSSPKTRNLGSLYFASVDIYHCYDNIDQKHLYNLVSAIISEDEYLIQKHAIIHPFDGKNSKSCCKGKKVVGTPGCFVNFPTLVEELTSHHSDSIMLDGINCQIAKKGNILALIKEHLSNHVVVAKRRFGPQLLVQDTGIPQGSVLSTMLCNFYYGDIEKQFLEGVFITSGDNFHKHFIVRMVDDFLLVTTDHKTCERFMIQTSKGVPNFGVQINATKSRVSHNTKIENSDGIESYRWKSCCVKEGGKQYFPWCGMLFDVDTCAVRVDYSRFAGTMASDSLTIDRIQHEGLHLEKRMITFVKPRCQPIFFDPIINSTEDIKSNFYCAIAFCALKTVSNVTQGMMGGVGQNERFIVKCIDSVIMFAFNFIDISLRDAKAKETMLGYKINHTHAYFWLKKEDAIWLALHAFKSVFCFHSNSEYLSVIKDLERRMSEGSMTLRHYNDITRVASEALAQFDLDRFKRT